MKAGKQPLTLRVNIPAALARQLGARRKQTGQSLSAIIVQALERSLGDEDKTVFQTSTVDALMEGASEGDMTMGELKTHGDFGLGTFDGLDGEMIELDGKVYVPVVRNNQLHLAEVTLGYDNGQQVEIISGVNPSDKVALNVGQAARDGQNVQPVENSQ